VELERWKQIGSHYGPGRASGGPPERDGLRILGQFFELFIAVEYEDALYLIDQHAAHERIIYDRISAPDQHHQSLLVPLGFDTEEEESRLLAQRQDEFAALGIGLRRAGEHSWELTAVPERCTGMEEELIDFLQAATVPGETLRSALFADLACKAAVKDGERLDAVSAAELARQALALPVPRCPHGRPVWRRIDREELLHAVGRL
jgi:DNA mismatch repair protein MutL